ncbi:MAG: Flp pilus assembly protein CpaB, partial [Deltaproteobacteria bacterium]|nr:Flp pilus assembly protein CpaB [Deltaproteobacteria bacterium]
MSPKEKRASGVGALVFTVLALLFTGVTAWLLAMMLSGTQYTKEPVLPVVVTQSAVEPLGPLTEANLKVVKLPESTIPAGHFTEISQLVHTPPTRSLVAMHEGEIVFKDRLVDLENGKGLASLVPSGMRAMVIKLDDAAVQAGLFQPDTMVDVIATLRLIKQSTVVSRVIVQGVKVMAVGKSIDPSHMAEPSGAGTLAGKSEEV